MQRRSANGVLRALVIAALMTAAGAVALGLTAMAAQSPKADPPKAGPDDLRDQAIGDMIAAPWQKQSTQEQDPADPSHPPATWTSMPSGSGKYTRLSSRRGLSPAAFSFASA
jgi:hypothetical protein